MKILQWPDPALKKTTELVTNFDEELRSLSSEMIRLMYESEGVGLAAPQVGSLKKIFVMDTLQGHGEKVLVNPVILEKTGTIRWTEGCLSFPGVSIETERSNKIKVKYQDIKGQKLEESFEGLAAICVQHEIDHLNGETFLKYISRKNRRMLEAKLRKKK